MSARDKVLVTGLGPVGLSVSLLATHLGCDVTGVDYVRERCSMAEELGVVRRAVCTAGLEDQECLESVRDGGSGFHVAVDCSGTEKARLLALNGLLTIKC